MGSVTEPHWLTRRVDLSRRWELSLVMIALSVVVGMHLWIGLRTDAIPCTLDCGETYEAYIGARNLDRFGWRYAGGLQDYSASPDLATHPMVYAHNPNAAMHYFLLLFRLGIHNIHIHAVWLTVPFFAGLLYLYWATRIVTGDRILSALCVLNAASLYLLVEIWGYHGVRVWSFLVTWGLVYHIVRWADPSR